MIAQLEQRIASTLRPFVAESAPVALLDFPSHSNPGDSAIWLGELRALASVGAPTPVYSCDVRTYDEATLRRRLGEAGGGAEGGTIFFTGGGSFGDLWEKHLLFREHVTTAFPRHRIVQLAECVHFERPESLARALRVFGQHPRFTLLVRDDESLRLATASFDVPVLLCPDMAMALGTLDHDEPPQRDVLWLLRGDKESRGYAGVPADAIDWLHEPQTRLIAGSSAIGRFVARRRWAAPLLRAPLAAAAPRLASMRLARGLSLLRTARVVVTDRLHGHILCVLLGIPHVLLDNSYGKLRRFFDTWTSRLPLARWADSATEAADAARDLLATGAAVDD